MFRHALFLIAFVAIARLLPHPPNFAPVTAVSIYCGARFGAHCAVVPIIAMLMSDMVIGFHSLVPVVYSLMILNAYIGTKLHPSTAVITGSLLFFIITNFAMWLVYYDYTFTSLAECYALALPFYKYSLLGDVVYSMILFGLGSLVNVNKPMRFNTVQ